MIDPSILEAAAKGLAMVFGKTIGETGIELLSNISGTLLDQTGNLTKAAQDLLFPISRKYVEKYTERHGILKVLGMGRPVSLDSVYTKVNFQADTILHYQSLDAQEQVFRQRELKDNEKRPGLDVANQVQYLMVLGNPGTGKTTFLRKVGLEALKGKREEGYQHTCIPVLLELRKFRSEGKIDLVQEIASEFENCGLPEYQDCTKKLLEKGRLLILLDGLDEVPSYRLSEMTTQIRDLLDRYSKNRFITSCRIAAYRNFDNFRRFTDVAIADFDDEQIETFICKWFESHSQPEWGQQCWSKLNSGEHNATKELTRTPLLLTLICILFKKRGEFPNKRATVYNEALWTLLSEWDASKEIVRSEPYKGMDTKCKEIMLAKIAHDNFVDNNLFIQQGEITQQIEKILGDILPRITIIDGRVVLRAIEEQHGVLVSRADDIYSFSHLTLQEFLTAKQIVDSYKDIEIEQLVANHLCDRRWREVFLILAGLRTADNLLLVMEKGINSLVNSPKLQGLLTWVERVTDTTAGGFKPVGKRAIVLASAYANSYALTNAKTHDGLANILANAYSLTNVLIYDYLYVGAYAYANAYELGNELDNELASANDNAIDKFINYAKKYQEFKIYKNVNFPVIIDKLEQLKEQMPGDREETTVIKDFSRRIIKTWLEAFYLTSEMIDLSQPEIQALDNYFYANLLIVQCKEAAVLVSRETWEGIESQMLLPSNS